MLRVVKTIRKVKLYLLLLPYKIDKYMKIQIDSSAKTIKIEGNVKLSDLIKHLESLLPKDCKLGYWKDYELECTTVINNWNYPIIIKDYTPYNPTPFWYQQPYTVTCGTDNGGITYTSASTNTCVYNLELN